MTNALCLSDVRTARNVFREGLLEIILFQETELLPYYFLKTGGVRAGGYFFFYFSPSFFSWRYDVIQFTTWWIIRTKFTMWFNLRLYWVFLPTPCLHGRRPNTKQLSTLFTLWGLLLVGFLHLKTNVIKPPIQLWNQPRASWNAHHRVPWRLRNSAWLYCRVILSGLICRLA